MCFSRISCTLAMTLGILCAADTGTASAETAQYTVTFESTWSRESNPIDFPLNAHFSGLIGGSHSDQVSFWSIGAPASTGIKNMAEQGDKTALMQEVQLAIAGGTADAVLSGGGLGTSPGSVTMSFELSDAFPLVTLVSMLAPSPDWFVGVSGLSLRENGAWIPQVVVPLVARDAGTDSGPTYTSPNQATTPPVPISTIGDGPLGTNNVVGTFTFVRTVPLGVPWGSAGEVQHLVSLGPNPLREQARFRFQVPPGRRAELAVYGVGGQRIRALFHGETPGGPRVVSWDGRDDRNILVPPGLYFVALRGDGMRPLGERVVVAR